MKNKLATIVIGTILTATAGSLPSYALGSSEYSASNSGTNSNTVSLNDNLDSTNNQTVSEQVYENEEFVDDRGRHCRTHTTTVTEGGITRTVRRWICSSH